MKNRKFTKVIALVLVAALCLAALAGCTKKPSAPAGDGKDASVINVAVIQGPTGVGMASLMENAANKATEYSYNFQLLSGPEQTVALLKNGDVDIAAMPTNLAANFNAKGGDITLLAVNTLGVLYIADATGAVTDINSLRGKTIYSTGQGSNPEFILDYVLEKNGIDPDKDVEIVFLAENTELSAKMIAGEAQIALVPEPLLSTITTKNANVKPVLSMTDEWTKAGGEGALMMGCVAVRNEFLKNSPKAVASFMKEYEASVKACENVETVAPLCVKHKIIGAEPIAKKAIPRCNIVFITGNDMKTQLTGYFNVLYAANPKSIGEKIPDDNFYYKK